MSETHRYSVRPDYRKLEEALDASRRILQGSPVGGLVMARLEAFSLNDLLVGRDLFRGVRNRLPGESGFEWEDRNRDTAARSVEAVIATLFGFLDRNSLESGRVLLNCHFRKTPPLRDLSFQSLDFSRDSDGLGSVAVRYFIRLKEDAPWRMAFYEAVAREFGLSNHWPALAKILSTGTSHVRERHDSLVLSGVGIRFLGTDVFGGHSIVFTPAHVHEAAARFASLRRFVDEVYSYNVWIDCEADQLREFARSASLVDRPASVHASWMGTVEEDFIRRIDQYAVAFEVAFEVGPHPRFSNHALWLELSKREGVYQISLTFRTHESNHSALDVVVDRAVGELGLSATYAM